MKTQNNIEIRVVAIILSLWAIAIALLLTN